MNGADTKLNVILTAQDEASSAIQAASNNIKSSLGEVEGSSKSASESLKGIGTSMLTSGAEIAAGGTAILAPIYAVVSAAADAEAAMARANTTTERFVDSLNEAQYDKIAKQIGGAGDVLGYFEDKVKGAGEAAVQLGFDDEDASNAMATLLQRTGDATKAQQLLTLAMDLSRAKNIDLTTATNLVGQALSGNGRALKQYGIDIKDSATPLEALGVLQTKVGGQADAFAKTFAGQSQVLQITFQNLEETIGAQLLPILTSLLQKATPIIQAMIDWVEKHQTLVKWVLIITAALGTFLVVAGSIIAILGAIAIFIGALLSPIGLVVLAIGALIAAAAAIVIFWTPIKDFFKGLWDDVKKIFSDAWNWINTNVIQPMVNAIQNLINKVANSPIGKAASAIGGAASSAWNSVTSLFRASGGPVSGGSPYIVGEEGPELFVPGMSGNIVPNGGFGGGGGAMAVTVNINGGLITDDVAKQIGNVIIQQFKRTSRW